MRPAANAVFGGAPGGKGGKSSSGYFFVGDSNLKLPNLSKTTCPGGMIGLLEGGMGLFFFGISRSFFGGGSFIAIAFLILILFFSGGGGGGIFFTSSTPLPFNGKCFSGNGTSSIQSSRSGFFLNLEPLAGMLLICIFHFVGAPLAASATTCRAFCSRVGDGESKFKERLVGLRSPISLLEYCI